MLNMSIGFWRIFAAIKAVSFQWINNVIDNKYNRQYKLTVDTKKISDDGHK